MGKVYYWIKLAKSFFETKEIKKLQKQSGGDHNVIIYIRILQLSLPYDGFLYFDGLEEDLAAEIALELDLYDDDVRVVIAFLLKYGLLEQRSESEFYLTQIPELLGKEDESASRQRKRREKLAEKRDNVTQLRDNITESRDNVQKCHTEIDIDIEKELELQSDIDIDRDCSSIYRGECNNVILLDWQWKKLKELFPDNYRERVDRLSRYIHRTGKNYPSHYATIVSWAKEDGQINEQTAKAAKAEERNGSFDTDSFFDAALQRTYQGIK